MPNFISQYPTSVSNTHTPLVSVIVPSYNHGKYIEQCINSVLAQTYKNIEIIVCDDGSTDNTAEVLKQYTSHPQVRILLFSENRGQSAVIKDGIAMSGGEYLAFLPSDDFYLPCNIEKKIDKFRESPPGTGVVYSKAARYFEDSQKTVTFETPIHTGMVLKYFLEEPNFVYPVTPLFLRQCFDVFKFNLNARAEGEAVYPEIAIHFGFEYVNEVLCVMRDHKTNTGKRLHGNLADSEARWRIFFARNDLPADIPKYRRQVFSWLYSMYGMGMIFDLEDLRLGRVLLIKSALYQPLKFRSIRNVALVIISLVPLGLQALKLAQRFKRSIAKHWPA